MDKPAKKACADGVDLASLPDDAFALVLTAIDQPQAAARMLATCHSLRQGGHWCARTTRWVATDELPAHGLYASADDFKERAGWSGGSEGACIVGVDPGVIEIISAVAIDSARHVKYTNRQRRAESGVVVNMRRLEQEKTHMVRGAEVSLGAFDSRALGFAAYQTYCTESLRTLEVRLKFYGDIQYRQRR
jgi:hypothetical protein